MYINNIIDPLVSMARIKLNMTKICGFKESPYIWIKISALNYNSDIL